MQGIASFDLKYPSMYYIAYLAITSFFVLLYAF